MDRYAKMLNFEPKIMKDFEINLARNAIEPLIMTKGSD